MGIIATVFSCNCTPQYHDRTWKRRQGSRQGRSQETQESLEGQHSGHHEACHPKACKEGWRQENLWLDLRGDQGCSEGVPGERDQGRRHLHRACQEEDRYCYGCCLCSQEAGAYSVWLWRIVSCSFFSD